MNMRRALLVIALAGVALLAAALPAAACSCLEGDPRDQFNDAEAAIVGEFVGQRPSEDPDEYEAIYSFNVTEEWKVDFGETLDVYSADNGAACGLEAQPGQSVGLFLRMEGDEWHSSLCSQISPQRMWEAASPLPEPNGSGPTRMVVGGSFGNARVAALDGDGQTLRYGFGGNHDVADLDACPGGRKFVEIYEDWRTPEFARSLVVRRVSDLEVVRETPLPFQQSKYVNGLDCRNEGARSVLLFVAPSYGKPDGAIYRETADGLKRLFRDLDARSAEFGDNHVYLSGARQRVSQMKLDGSSSKILFTSGKGRALSEPLLSPDGSHLAVIAFGTYEPQRPAHLALVRLEDGKVWETRHRGVGYGGLLAWDASRRIVFLSSTSSRVYSLKLERVGSLGPAYAADAQVIGNKLWAVAYGELLKANLPDGELQRDRMLPSPVTHALIRL